MNNLEDCILRHIFNNLDIKNIRKISSVCRIFNNLEYKHQCIPLGIYKWIYGNNCYNIEKSNEIKNNLLAEYCYLRYIKDIIYFLEDITIYREYGYGCKSYFTGDVIVDEYGNNKFILKHKVYRVNVNYFYRNVINSLNLKAIIY